MTKVCGQGLLQAVFPVSVVTNFWQEYMFVLALFEHHNAFVHKASSIKSWFRQFGVEELGLVSIQPQTQPCPTPFPTAKFQNLDENLKPKGWN